ncbi:S9 family peptidase [Litoribacter ruber]|uniref:S9 family peptidase n=1 Tax=Litoribacter ruber TaxID=702568 RepID=UPI001BDAB8CE|nr:prolyl oligopeptidase family serine peptidase [Litoribacter ruber]MBT0811029.1 S9 family peptidase [Litoribacter ruber]
MKKICLFLLIALMSFQGFSQQKTLQLEDYKRWSRIVQPVLADDGSWFAYSLRPNGGDDTLHLKNIATDNIERFENGSNPIFSSDVQHFAFFTQPGKKKSEELKKEKKPVTKTAFLKSLGNGKTFEVSRADKMEFSEDGKFWAVHRTKPEGKKNSHKGSDLVIHDLESGNVMTLGNVEEFSFNKRSDKLAYTVSAEDKIGNGVFLLDLHNRSTQVLDAEKSDYKHLVWDDHRADRKEWGSKGKTLAFLKGVADDSLIHTAYDLLVFANLDNSPNKHQLEKDNTALADLVISDLSRVYFQENGKGVWVGLKQQEAKVKMSKDTIPNVDVWHHKDDRIQSVQMVRAERNRRNTDTGLFDFEKGTLTQLTDHPDQSLVMSNHNRYLIKRDEKPYVSDINWGVSPADLYRVDVSSGDEKMIEEEINRPLEVSPNGRFYIYQKDSALIVYDLENDRKVNVSEKADVSFMNMDHPYPHENPPYGVAGWTKDENHVIVNHEFDLWLLALDGSSAENLTKIGTDKEIRFRLANLEREEKWVDLDKTIILTAYGEWTKKSGFYALEKGKEPSELVYDDAMFGSAQKARNTEKVVFTRQTFTEFPDYHLADMRFGKPKKLTNANPQHAEYAWGKRKLVDFENGRGDKLQGTLTLPANYEEGKSYPTIIYFYEKMSDRHHQYSMPVYDDRPHMSTYASNGYMVFMPDNVYEEGRPGTSALDGITSAANKLIELGYADADRIGLQGHSWSGYQTSFILTKTDMFKCIVTGAPPTNLESFYNNIYGSSGTVHHGIMEIGQVRMGRGVTPWTHREDYQRENPMFHIQNINTPFLILHGTKDGAVDWAQGLELYNAARRMGKEVIFLSYPNEGHHLTNEANQKDFQVRMKEYFDHYLMDKEAPTWMESGVPHSQKLYEMAE